MATKELIFTYPRRAEDEFRRAIQKLFLVEFPKSASAGDIQERLLEFVAKRAHFEKFGEFLARRMVTQVRASNARSWREAARKASRGREIYRALQTELEGPVGVRVQQIIEENAKLISSIPEKVAESIAREIANSQFEGLRPETISEHLRKRVPKLTKSRAALIARTETSKASTALTQARAEDLGIDWYQWQTSEDQRVRPSHRVFDKVLVRWSDPPAPEQIAHVDSKLGHYAAGDAPNCRCMPMPLISLDVIAFPARVYHGGRIERMTRAKFEQFTYLRSRQAA